MDKTELNQLLCKLRTRLINSRQSTGYWTGNLSSSALSTATAVFALYKADPEKHKHLINKGLDWIAKNVNPDGGWGDTVRSISNISTTLLCWSALTASNDDERYRDTIENAQRWIKSFAGSLEPLDLVNAVYRKYGKDRTFSVPILTMCALAGRLGDSSDIWKQIKPLPFELAALPHKLFKWLDLSVVSYALPALIAIGQVNFYHRKPINPATRLLRHLTSKATLKTLSRIQPENGGFLEAAPLTSFVTMSLLAAGHKDHVVVNRAIDFLVASARDDGSWPIDTNLATWISLLSVNALSVNYELKNVLSDSERETILNWFLSQQYTSMHPYTNAAPGGWAWTDLPGAVPDADDTSGVLIALKNLDIISDQVNDSVRAGLKWLMGIQNRDGGIPTFCRGWSKLDFDRSSCDITAHAVNAMNCWQDSMDDDFKLKVESSLIRAITFLERSQHGKGYWLPLWFGNQFAKDHANPVYGTSKTIISVASLPDRFGERTSAMLSKGIDWLISAQNSDGGFGGDIGIISSIEETALATDAISSYVIYYEQEMDNERKCSIKNAIDKGLNWLLINCEPSRNIAASPIGLYFAKLWYYEELYPLIFTVRALEKISTLFGG